MTPPTLAPTLARVQIRNLILCGLPDDQLNALLPHLVPMELPRGLRLLEPKQVVEFIYFVNHGLVSMDAFTLEGDSVEVGVVGYEGIAGAAILLGQENFPHLSMMQMAGSGYRIKASILQAEFAKGGRLLQLVHAFLYTQLVQISQSVLCNRMHEVEARLARWMLMSADRTQSESLDLTQEFLAQMLGSRRSSVTVAAGKLQTLGMIRYTRGRIQIVDRDRLEQMACECYHIVRDHYLDVFRIR
ncbi:MAG TPA: Crp/Fnr family transcriptional regulator [Acidobacteriaceae bacterium]|jgi:CRP-like cAMP-binding protein|nr:Crp/Fnr family transcriptional regulator [Acidobacteriaceae bacterium]